MLSLGFTGTQQGMTIPQFKAVGPFLKLHSPDEVHHGLCIGSDEEFHNHAKAAGIKIIGHPPINKSKVFKADWSDFWCLWEPRDYLERNRYIVQSTVALLATPKGMIEENRSGTGATIRHARFHNRPICILWPDGTKSYENWRYPE